MSDRTWIRRALAEFVAISVGVLLALVANSSWEARSDRARAAEYLTAVLDEIHRNTEILSGTANDAMAANRRLERSSHILTSGLLADSASGFVAGLVGAVTFIPSPVLSRAVFDDLVSTGSLRLLGDDNVRRAILEAYALMAVEVDRMRIGQASISPGLDALISRYLPPNTITRTGRYNIVISDTPTDQLLVRRAAAAIAADADFLGELNAEYRRLERARQQIVTFQEVLRQRVEDVEALAHGADGGSA
jgi:hypothetical protein